MRQALVVLLAACLALAEEDDQTLLNVKWCAVGDEEFQRCGQLKADLDADGTLQYGRIRVHPEPGSPTYAARLECVEAHHIFECAEMISEGYADITRVSAEDLFSLAETKMYPEIVPVAAGETGLCEPGAPDCHAYAREYSVAVVKKLSNMNTLASLRDRRACFSPVGSVPGWVIPVFHLRANWTHDKWPINPGPGPVRPPTLPPLPTRTPPPLPDGNDLSGGGDSGPRQTVRTVRTPPPLPPLPGNRRSKRATSTDEDECALDLNIAFDVFPQSCAPGDWATDESFGKQFGYRLCSSCAGQNTSCLASVPANDPLECLRSGEGDVAFVSNVYLQQWLRSSGANSDHFSLLCRSGQSDVYAGRTCHWGVVPADSFIASRAPERTYSEKIYASFVQKLYSNAKENFYASVPFISGGQRWTDIQRLDRAAAGFGGAPTSKSFLQKAGGDSFYVAMQHSVPQCRTKDRMRLCLLSQEELHKCQHIKMSFREAALPPSLECVIGYSADNCVKMLKNNEADVAVMEAHRADHFTHDGDIRALLEETFAPGQEQYAVAVTLGTGRAKALSDLKTGHLNVCSAGTDSYAGWEAANRALKEAGVIPSHVCKLNEEWAKLFRTSCVPGAQNATVTLGRNDKDVISKSSVSGLCASCTGGPGSCLTPAEASDDIHEAFDNYYGDVGALRCLVRRKGDVAFVRSSALLTMVYLQQLGDEDFRAIDLNNFHLLCSQGGSETATAASIPKCNLGAVPRRWIVTRVTDSQAQLRRWQDLWLLALERARDRFDWLRTYVHLTPGRTDHLNDLIFTNSTLSLERFALVNLTESEYHELAYGKLSNPFVCGKGATPLRLSILALVIASYFSVLYR